MKVAMIDPSAFTAPYDFALAAGIAETGSEPRLYLGNLPPDDRRRGAPGVVELFYRGLDRPPVANLPKGLRRLLKGFSHVSGMRLLVEVLRDWRPDVIHFQWFPLPIVDRRFLPALRRIAPVVATVHDSNPFNGNPTSRLQVLGTRSVLGRTDALIVHTEQAAQRLRRSGLGARRIVRIPHGPLHDTAPEREPVRRSTIEFLLFGKLKPYKGLDVLIRATALLPPDVRQRFRVRVVGQPYMPMGPIFELMESQGVADRFLFDLRFVAEAEIPALFRQADAAVFPYREIDASGMLMTALAAERPVIASALGCFAELLRDGETALLVPPGDPVALARALGRIVGDEVLRWRLAEAGRQLQDNLPGWREIGEATRALYDSLVGNPPVRSGLAA
ncbi:MAG TPA: glycosyltransferase family 4 protein [Stellaceae bacterium]|nr:glycosyltransferase family 4 protein [Stellaceae bacterium]